MKADNDPPKPPAPTESFRLRLLRSHVLFSLATALLVALAAFVYLKGKLIESRRENLVHACEARSTLIAASLERARLLARLLAERPGLAEAAEEAERMHGPAPREKAPRDKKKEAGLEAPAGGGTDGAAALEKLLRAAVSSLPEVESAAVRTPNGRLLARAGAAVPGEAGNIAGDAGEEDGGTGGGDTPIRDLAPPVDRNGSPHPKEKATIIGAPFLFRGAPHLRVALPLPSALPSSLPEDAPPPRPDRPCVLVASIVLPSLEKALGEGADIGRSGRARIGPRRGAGLAATRNDKGIPVFAAFRPIEGTDFGLVVEMNRTEFTRPVWKAALLILVSAALLVSASVFLSLKRMGPIADLMVLWNRSLRKEVAQRTEALERSEAMYRLLAESVADGEVILRDGRIAYANRAFRSLTGIGEDFWKGASLEAWVLDGDIPAMERRDGLRRGGTVPEPRYRLKLKDGKGGTIHAEVVEREISFQGGPALLLSLRDVGAIRRLRMYETFLPTCSVCKAVRDDAESKLGEGEWVSLEEYVRRHSEARMSHTYCPECERRLLASHGLE